METTSRRVLGVEAQLAANFRYGDLMLMPEGSESPGRSGINEKLAVLGVNLVMSHGCRGFRPDFGRWQDRENEDHGEFKGQVPEILHGIPFQ